MKVLQKVVDQVGQWRGTAKKRDRGRGGRGRNAGGNCQRRFFERLDL